MAKFAERLRSLRTAKGLSQSEFAKQIKISKSSVNMYERGEREPSFKTLEQIADYFNVDMDYLLGKSHIVNRLRSTSIVSHDPCEQSFILSVKEQMMIQKFRKLDERGQSAVLNVLNFEYDSLPGEKAHAPAKEA